MTIEDRKVLRKKINEEIVKVKAAIVPLLDATKPISPENSLGRVSRMDAINNKSG
jgi:DnaK suppressor protein